MAHSRFSTLSEWLRWQETCHPNAIDLGLDRVRRVARALNITSDSATVITVAGTNGKGSCVRALEAMLSASGGATGSYSSPHLLNYNERIRIQGVDASDDMLCDAFAAIDAARGEISLTYFEFGTLAALLLFARAGLDYWLLEVGLGGRLDACNIIDPDIAVITSIDLDHMDWLGDTREAIGREKAGICRPGRPLICADRAPPSSITGIVQEQEIPCYCIGQDFDFRAAGEDQFEFFTNRSEPTRLRVSLPPASVAAALQVCDQLKLLKDETVRQQMLLALQAACLPGRLEIVAAGGRTLTLDVAHNPAAMAFLADRLRNRAPDKRYLAVVAMMGDKDMAGSLAALGPIVDTWLLAPIEGVPRSASVDALVAALPAGSKYRTFLSLDLALDHAFFQNANEILVTGSFYTVGCAKSWLKGRFDEADG